MESAYLRVQDPPDPAVPDVFPTQDAEQHECNEHDIRDGSGDDRDPGIHCTSEVTKVSVPLSVRFDGS
jgi:hypothetical protein